MGGESRKKLNLPPTPFLPSFLLGTGEKGRQSLEKKFRYNVRFTTSK